MRTESARPTKLAALVSVVAASICLGSVVHGEEVCEPGWDDTFLNQIPTWGGAIFAFTIHEGDLLAGGTFQTIDGVAASRVARWDGTSWHPLGSGVDDTVWALAVYDGDVYAGTDAGLTRWDGSSWTAVPGEMLTNPKVNALAVFNGELYVGGHFRTIGELQVNQIARWNGSTWNSLGPDFMPPGYPVNGLTVYNNFLVVVGNFPRIGCQQFNRVAMWSGGGWYPFGGTANCEELACHSNIPNNPDCGTGASPFTAGVHDGELIVAGAFAAASNTFVRSIARWSESAQMWLGYNEECPNPDHTTFTCGVGGSLPREILAVASYDGRLVAGGLFDLIGGVEVSNIASGDGVEWEPLGSGTDNRVYALIEYDGKLIAGGSFNTAGGISSRKIAAWNGCLDGEPIVPGDLNGDGVVDGADLLILLSNWGQCADPDDCPADLNGDGVVDGADLLILLSNWG